MRPARRCPRDLVSTITRMRTAHISCSDLKPPERSLVPPCATQADGAADWQRAVALQKKEAAQERAARVAEDTPSRPAERAQRGKRAAPASRRRR